MNTIDIPVLEAPRYVPEWTRPDSPTRTLSERDLKAYYAAHSVAGDCRFATRPGSGIPLDLRAVYASLLVDLEDRKQTPADKRLIEDLRTAWRGHADGRPYAVPLYLPSVRKRKAARAHVCPKCGHVAAA